MLAAMLGLLISVVGLLVILAVYLARKLLREGALALKVTPPKDRQVAQAHLKKICDESGWETINYKRQNGENLSMVYARVPNSAYLIVLSHGRGGDLTTKNDEEMYTELAKVKALHDLGASVLCYDYSGFGASTGVRSESSFVADCEATFNYAEQQLGWPRKQIVAAGQSLGTGVLIQYLKREHGYAGVMLFHPYRSIGACRSVFLARYLCRCFDYFPSESSIHLVQGPVLIVHADSDLTVPYSHGVYLAKRLELTGQHIDLVTLHEVPPNDAHARLFIVEPHRSKVQQAVSTFLDFLKELPRESSASTLNDNLL